MSENNKTETNTSKNMNKTLIPNSLKELKKAIYDYKSQFENKVILCDYEEFLQPVFFNFFKENFKDLKIKKLIGFNLMDENKQPIKYIFENNDIVKEKLDGTSGWNNKLFNDILVKENVDIVLASPPFGSDETKKAEFKKNLEELIKENRKFLLVTFNYAIRYINELIIQDKVRIGLRSSSFFRNRYFIKGDNSGWNRFFYTNLEYEFVDQKNDEKYIKWSNKDYQEHPKVFFKNEELLLFTSNNRKKIKAKIARNLSWNNIPSDYYDKVVCEVGFARHLAQKGFKYLGSCEAKDLVLNNDTQEKYPKILSNDKRTTYIIVQRNKPLNETKKSIKGYNAIFYGLPGCGKSYKISEEIKKEGAKYFRTVFHPDYSNADFVGQIIPKINDDLSVSYSFNPGPFSLALQEAYNNLNEPVYLIIEEINRGNGASIFGELFQLLDRDENGCSQYGINHVNLMDFLIKNNGKKEQNINALKLLNQNNFSSENDHENYQIYIPSNLIILATMNTSDQNVFVLDTAFKRRWEFVLISNEFSDQEQHQNYFIPGTSLTWKKFLNKINNEILDTKRSFSTLEDKRLGKYFVSKKFLINPNDNSQIDDNEIKNKFAQKVFEYLWNDVFKFERKKVFKESYFDDQNMKQEIKTSEDLINAFVQGYEIFNEFVDIKFFDEKQTNQE
ncbi:AAA family ATPase [Mycoplasma sp. E35C]|uniref:AAA family ATPase n=1 Tax=Mycoplasma sp. E35C TaxID=2801918 RepID=UPI001CA387BC|nr:AAA family ATPase [Mycoplasma sp. E35C]QZX49470.1 AAA family ATPase [Mycoplasma sp. E35C]